MNMFQLQERIKDFSKDQLVKEMQQPSGAVPPFLVLSELQRRTRMEKAFQAEQAQGHQRIQHASHQAAEQCFQKESHGSQCPVPR